MRRRLFAALGLGLALALTLSAVSVAAQEKKKSDRVEGIVQAVDHATNTVTVRLKAKTNTVEVIYSDKTHFTFRNKAGTLDEVKAGRNVICLGTLNDKAQLMATRIDVRDEQ